MAEELQNLLERIQQDGVAKAQAEAERIIAEAKSKAGTITKKAEEDAKAIIQKADTDAKAFGEKGKKSLEQAARDVILIVRDAINKSFENVVRQEVAKTLDQRTIEELLVKIVEAYCKADSGGLRAEILVKPAQEKVIKEFFAEKFQQEVIKGIEIKPDNSVVAGFRVSFPGKKVQHDFTDQAITEALSRILRPHIAEILKG